MNKIDRRVKRTKKNIRSAFITLLQQKDISKITVTELADLADIDRKTFYLHYYSLDDILTEIENELVTEMKEIMKELDRDFLIKNFIAELNNLMLSNIDFYKLISKETSFYFLKNKFKEILKGALYDELYDEKNMKAVEFSFYIEFIASGVIGIYTNWLSDNTHLSLEDLTLIIEKSVINGLSNIT